MKQINLGLKPLSKWLITNISLNTNKTELQLFHPPKKLLDHELRIRLNVKKLNQAHTAKYLGIHIDENLNWKYHLDDVVIKSNKASGMLSKSM